MFPRLEADIASAIEKLGAVFPKLNWSSPRVRLRCASMQEYCCFACARCACVFVCLCWSLPVSTRACDQCVVWPGCEVDDVCEVRDRRPSVPASEVFGLGRL